MHLVKKTALTVFAVVHDKLLTWYPIFLDQLKEECCATVNKVIFTACELILTWNGVSVMSCVVC